MTAAARALAVWLSAATTLASPFTLERTWALGRPAPRATSKKTTHKGRAKGPAPQGPPRSTTLPRTPVGSPVHERKIAALREQLEAALHEPPLSTVRVGVAVITIADGDVLFSHNADGRFNPASNTKMLTTAAAISRLGGDYRYLTAVYGPPPDVDGVVAGDLVLRGSSDPSLSSANLVELASALAARGITRVRGNVLVDRRPIGFDGTSDAGIILDRNTISVRVRPTEPKRAPVVSMEPATAGITVENRATTVKGKRTRLVLDTYRKDDHLVIVVRGRIGDARGTVTVGKRVADGALLAAHTWAKMLEDFGITLEGKVKAGTTPAGAVELAVHRSEPLADVSRLSNKPSNNFIADTIYKTLGGELFGLPGTLEKGTRAVSDWLVEHGIAKERFHLVNGSGLTHENRVTPIDLARLLRAIYFEPEVAPDFIPSLAVGGVDGTLRQRFYGTPAAGLVRGKTGTLDSVSTLSGYVGDKGDVIAFSIMVEGFRWRRMGAMRHAQVRLVQALLRYLRADALGDGHDEPLHVPPEDGPESPLTSPPDDNDDPEGDPEADPAP